ncbi:fungal-specific transcription factor domain-containing protein [Hypoxylon argillaceum]|nr:fungal-specific transcription factor domain-containing protein [Hypoxylon argillaceum]
MRPPMRSSIACTRCRQSKIKCENTNGTSPCNSCIKTGNECIFKVPDHVPPKRSDPPVAVKQERDGGSDRKRLKKIDDISKGDSQKVAILVEDVLSASFLTEDLWEQVLDLYKLHFAPELPFLHLPTMKEKLGRISEASNPEQRSGSNLVLLGVLTLTARFHPDLVRYTAHICNSHSGNARTRPLQSQPDPAAASEYYADILALALGPVRTTMSTASLDRVAALLMLGLYEWSQTQPKTGGMTAWMYVGNAIRMAQFLGLCFEDAREPGGSKFRAIDSQLKSVGRRSQLALQKEIRRRIMFSCFILDRMLACGKDRVPIIRSEDLNVQLPCSEDKFDLAIEVQTGRLNQLERSGSDDSILSRFIQLVNLWGEISNYSSRGGRVEDKHPPWHPESDFYNLNKALEAFDSSLQETFTFSRSNYFKHENHLASSTFILLHMLRFVCLIMLHREYVPFVPIRCHGPEGPLDQPTFTKEETPAGFWRTSAEQLFKAARGIVDLIEICQRKDKLPQSTIVLFAIWTAAFVGLYGAHFPRRWTNVCYKMDTERHMLNFDFEDTQEDGLKDVFKRGPTALTFQTLLKMSTGQKMASTYVDILHGMNDYFDTIKQDYYRYSDQNGRPNKTRLRVREGGIGGGLEEYHPLVGKLKDFGSLRPDEHDVIDISERLRIRNIDRPSSDVDSLGTSQSAPAGSFTAINHGPTLPTPELTRPLRRAATTTAPAQMQTEPYVESSQYHNTLQQQTHLSPAQAYPTPSSVPEPGATHAPGCEPDTMDDCEFFWDKLQKDELRRFGATGDLSIFSTGQSEISVADIPFESSSYLPFLSDSSYQFLQQTGEHQM